MYAETLFNANMLYPIINARTDVPSAPFGKVETAFASGDAQQVLGTVCPLTDAPEYFLTMGDQAQSLQSFPYRAQYDSFHNEELIDAYVDGGTLVKVADYSQYGQGWALYRFRLHRLIDFWLRCLVLPSSAAAHVGNRTSSQLRSECVQTNDPGVVPFICFLRSLLFQLSAGRFSRMGWLGDGP